jgi:hypothetical protein
VFPKTSDKVGFIACLVIAIAIVIWMLWPRSKKPKGGTDIPAPVAGAVITDPVVDAGGNPVAGSSVGLSGAPRGGVSLSGTPPVEVPAPAPASVSFYDPGAPPVIE